MTRPRYRIKISKSNGFGMCEVLGMAKRQNVWEAGGAEEVRAQ
jgi:hypothetical protein